MKVSELIKKYEDNKKYNYRLEVKPIKHKDIYDITDVLLESLLLEDEYGVVRVDVVSKGIMLDVQLIAKFTNIEFDVKGDLDGVDVDINNIQDEGEAEDTGKPMPLTMLEQYDFLVENDIVDKVHSALEKKSKRQYNVLLETLDLALEQEVSIRNSLQVLVSRALYSAIDKIPDENGLMKIAKEVKGFDPKQIKTLMNLFNFSKGKTSVKE
jgi:hypothetical protein